MGIELPRRRDKPALPKLQAIGHRRNAGSLATQGTHDVRHAERCCEWCPVHQFPPDKTRPPAHGGARVRADGVSPRR